MVRREKSEIPLSGDKTCAEMIWTLQDHQRDLLCGIPTPITSDLDNT